MEIRSISIHDYEKAHALQCEYLDPEPFPDFIQRVERDSNLYFVAVDGDEVVGVCYGTPFVKDDSVFVLQGIAVNLDATKGFARVGIGSELYLAFEYAVKTKGYRKVGVGSAEDPKVEAFYLKNGFTPIEAVAKGLHDEEIETVSVEDFDTGNVVRDGLRRKHRPREVIFIFEKVVD